MTYHKIGFQYFFYKPYVWLSAMAILSAGSVANLKWQEAEQGRSFVEARATPETLAFESKYCARPGENKDVVTQVDFAPISHTYWVKRE